MPGDGAAPDAHHDRIDVVRLIVVRTTCELLEPLGEVEPLGGGIVGTDLEEHLTRATLHGRREQRAKKRPAPPLPPVLGEEGDGLDVGIGAAAKGAHPAVSDHDAVVLVHEISTVRALQLGRHGLGAPGIRGERPGLDGHDRVEVFGRGDAESHVPTFFGAPGRVTSGWRM
jgi:hypothetical protein